MDILAMITRATRLAEEAGDLFDRAKPIIDDIGADRAPDLATAHERLKTAIARARDAGADLDKAIAERLGRED